MKQLIYLALVIVAGVIAIKWYTSRNMASTAGAIKTVSAEEAKAQLDTDTSIVLLDVRTQEEFAEGHIPGAVCLPNESISADSSLPADKNARIFVYCRSGRRSAEAAKKLENLGYTDITDFGGIIDWPYDIVTE